MEHTYKSDARLFPEIFDKIDHFKTDYYRTLFSPNKYSCEYVFFNKQRKMCCFMGTVWLRAFKLFFI